MKIVIIHGQSHQGSTCHTARQLAEKLKGETKEFFLPRDFDDICTGCTACFKKDEKLCPHHEKLKPLTEALDEADVIILASPVYVYHVTGAMKNFLDHYGYRWIVHRPEETMFKKQAVCISTAAGAGTKSTCKDMADSMFFWGAGRIYKIGVNVRATSWKDIKPEIRAVIDRKTSETAAKIRKNYGRVKPSLKTRMFFEVVRILVKRGWTEEDSIYWQKKGWLGNKRPWK